MDAEEPSGKFEFRLSEQDAAVIAQGKTLTEIANLLRTGTQILQEIEVKMAELTRAEESLRRVREGGRS
jgi:hypothetical protein